MGRIVHIRHETGDLTEYTSTVTDGGDLSVDAAAALAGTGFGLSLLIDDTTGLRARKDFTALSTQTDFRTRIYIDPNSLTMATDDIFPFLAMTDRTNFHDVIILYLKYDGSTYQIEFEAYNDGGVFDASSIEDITDAPHYVEIHLAKASTDAASDGELKCYIDGSLEATLSNIDIFDTFELCDRCDIGAPYGIDAGTSGAFYLDELIIRDDGTEIGAHVEPADTVASGPLSDISKMFANQYGAILDGTSTGIQVAFGFRATYLRLANLGTTAPAYFAFTTGVATSGDMPLSVGQTVEARVPPCSGLGLMTASTSTTAALKQINVLAIG